MVAKRILLLNPQAELASCLSRVDGLQVAWMASRERLDQFRRLGIQGMGYEYNSDRSKVAPREIASVLSALRRERSHLLFAPTSRPLAHAVQASVLISPRPRIVAFRGITSPLHRYDPAEWLTYLNPCVDGYACESQAVREVLLRSGVAAGKCAVVYNFVPPPLGPGAERGALAEFDIPADAFVVGMVANMRRVKGADILLQAARLLADSPNLFWLLIGDVRDRRVRRMLQDERLRRQVRAAGFRSDAAHLMSALDVFAMPSRQEALCRALLEAMSRGVCPVVSDAGGLPEAVRGGIDGLVVPRNDPRALARAVEKLQGSPELVQQFGRSSAERSRTTFTAEQWCQRLLELFWQVLG